jgi:uncharacterized protein (TIGR02145 family)
MNYFHNVSGRSKKSDKLPEASLVGDKALTNRTLNKKAQIMRGSNVPIFIGVLLFVINTKAQHFDGRVINPDGTGKPGISVRVSSTNSTTTTDSNGYWSIGVSEGVLLSRSQGKHEQNINIDNQINQIAFNNHDGLGRKLKNNKNPQIPFASRMTGSIPDTIIYSSGLAEINPKYWNAFLRDTVSTRELTGIIRVFDLSWNANITYGYLLDDRDNQIYRYVTIGGQTWMAQNLNYSGPSGDVGSCYNAANNSIRIANCNQYGRLYDWATAMNGGSSTSANPSNVQGICPLGWHIPSDNEWSVLNSAANKRLSPNGGNVLKSTTWPTKFIGGFDYFGFRALPSGYRDPQGIYRENGDATGASSASQSWWSTTRGYELDRNGKPIGSNNPWAWNVNGTSGSVDRYNLGSASTIFEYSGFSLRCVRN